MSRLVSTLLALSLGVGCGPRPPPELPVASIAVPEPPTRAAATPSIAEPSTSTHCTLTLQVQNLEKPETCYLESRVHVGALGTLTYPCDRRGPAEAVFEDAVFKGDLTGARVYLSFERQFPYADHCTWTTIQQIDGSLDEEFLSFSYEEQAAEQQGCMAPCSATAQLQVTHPTPNH